MRELWLSESESFGIENGDWGVVSFDGRGLMVCVSDVSRGGVASVSYVPYKTFMYFGVTSQFSVELSRGKRTTSNCHSLILCPSFPSCNGREHSLTQPKEEHTRGRGEPTGNGHTTVVTTDFSVRFFLGFTHRDKLAKLFSIHPLSTFYFLYPEFFFFFESSFL